MEILKFIGNIAFFTGWGIGVASWFLGIYEFIAINCFSYSSFKYGKSVYFDSLPFPLTADSIELNEVIKTGTGKFKFINEMECLFSQKLKLWDFRVHTPFPIKGKISWRNGIADIVGRIPLGPTVFFGAVLFAWTGGALVAAAEGSIAGLILALGILIPGWLFVGAIYLFSVRYEIRRARRMVDELKDHLFKTKGFSEAS